MKIIVAAHNGGKLAEIRRILEERLGADAADIELVSAGSLGLPDPVEDGVTFQENALIKARDVAERTGCPAVADDSGLIVDVMGNAPGILSARWAGEHGNDKANNALLLKQLADIPDSKRTARFRCAAALVVPGERKADGADMISRTRSPAKPSKSAKCRACCCVPRAVPTVSATIRCLCRTISRSVRSMPAKSSRPPKWSRPRRTRSPIEARRCARWSHRSKRWSNNIG